MKQMFAIIINSENHCLYVCITEAAASDIYFYI